MFYGLSKLEEEFYADSLAKAVMFAPCTILEESVGYAPNYDFAEDGIFQYQNLGINSINGLSWQEDLTRLCSELDN